MFLPDRIISIQNGRFHLSFYMNRTFMSCFKCYKNKLFSKLSYDKQLDSCPQEIYIYLLNNLKQIITKDGSFKDDSIVSE